MYSLPTAVGDSAISPANTSPARVLFCCCSSHSISKLGNVEGLKKKKLELIYTQVTMANNINICHSSIILPPMKCPQQTRAEDLPAAAAPAAERSAVDTAGVAGCTGSRSQAISEKNAPSGDRRCLTCNFRILPMPISNNSCHLCRILWHRERRSPLLREAGRDGVELESLAGIPQVPLSSSGISSPSLYLSGSIFVSARQR